MEGVRSGRDSVFSVIERLEMNFSSRRSEAVKLWMLCGLWLILFAT